MDKRDLSFAEMTSLSGERAYLDKVTERDVYGEGSSEPFLPKQQAPIAFIYLPPSEQSPDNPYATQAAYNPSYKPTLNDTAGRDGIAENNEGNEIREEGTSPTLSRKTQVDRLERYTRLGRCYRNSIREIPAPYMSHFFIRQQITAILTTGGIKARYCNALGYSLNIPRASV